MTLEVVDLACGYRGIRVLQGIDMSIEQGQALTLLGANGVGKSTLLKTIMGVVPAMGGRIILDGKDLTRASAVARSRSGIAWVPEGRRLFQSLSVRENLSVGARGVSTTVATQRFDRVVSLFPEVAELQDRPAWALSGGQQQMVAIGRALMAGPKLLLLDEPSLGLAPLVVQKLLLSLSALRGEDMALCLVEQNVQAGLSIADRGMVLEKGHVRRTGTPAELLADDSIVRSYLSDDA